MSIGPLIGDQAVRVIGLYLSARRPRRALIGILGSAGLAWLLQVLNAGEPMVRMVQIVVPLVPAVVIGVSTWSPFGEVEHSASRPLFPLRLLHLGGLLACAVVAFGVADLTVPEPESGRLLVRNLAGYTGLAFIGARLFGPAFASTFAWALPLAYAALVWFVGDTVSWGWAWAWATQSSTSDSATAIAMSLLALGLTVILPAGSGARAGEGDVA